MGTATFSQKPHTSRARRFHGLAPLACIAALAALAVTPTSASDDATTEATPILASLDSLSRQTIGSWTARRLLEGELVDKHERGWMEVETRFDRRTGISHSILAECGSDRIRQRALASVLEKEAGAAREEEARRAAFSSENYRYRLLARTWDDVRVELSPLREDVRLVRGAAVLDAQSGHLLKVEGQLARNPSFWVRDVHIARTYARVGSVTLPVDLVSTARVRMFGAARLRIRTQYTSVDGRPVSADASIRLPARAVS
jgi:hypothetical protein